MVSRNHVAIKVILLATCLAPVGKAAEGEKPRGIEGIWQGDVPVRPKVDVTILFRISTSPDGSLTAAMDIPIQQVEGLPVESVSFEEGRLRLEVRRIQGLFEGRLEKNGSTVVGQWTQGPRTIPLKLKRLDEVPERKRRPQEPTRPYPYDDEEVTYENKAAGIRLNGTLTLPRASEPVPAVVLITGGGAQDRDETTAGHKPYLVLADSLTRRGIAVLRADDRGYDEAKHPRGMQKFLEWTSEDFAGDALSGVDYLKTRQEIDPTRIGLIGHSEGGLVAPMAAVRSSDVGFIVLLAGPGQTTEEAHHDQCRFILEGSGATAKIVKLAKEYYTNVFAMLRQEKNNGNTRRKLGKMQEELLNGLSTQEKEWIASLDRSMAGNPATILTPWLRYLLSYDPKVTLAKVTCPVLALAGGKDWQVPSEFHVPLIRQALQTGGHGKFTVRVLPNLNHLFQPCETGSPHEYASIEETFSPEALKIIGDWILDQVEKPH